MDLLDDKNDASRKSTSGVSALPEAGERTVVSVPRSTPPPEEINRDENSIIICENRNCNTTNNISGDHVVVIDGAQLGSHGHLEENKKLIPT